MGEVQELVKGFCLLQDGCKVEGGSSCKVEAAGAGKTAGGCLPPRKRLLADLKQNGLLPSGSSLSSSPPHSGLSAGAALDIQEAKVLADPTKEDVQEECNKCGRQDSSSWHQIKRKGLPPQRYCTTCSLHLICFYCMESPNISTKSSTWLDCSVCQRGVHMDCELKHVPDSKSDPASYICPDCSKSKNGKVMSNGAAKIKRKDCQEKDNLITESGVCSTLIEKFSKCNKKLRMSREPRTKPIQFHVVDLIQSTSPPGAVSGSDGRSTLSTKDQVQTASQEAAAAARAAAVLAAKAATAAKATAAAKAAAAVKAATVAKAALEAALFAARAEAQARKNAMAITSPTLPSLSTSITPSTLSSSSSLEKEKTKPNIKIENEELQGSQSAVDDEELARQLHRKINSSPRISRSSIPSRKKVADKPVPVQTTDDCKFSPQAVLPSPTEPFVQLKHQVTRPRSLSHKEGRRHDRYVKLDPQATEFEAEQFEGGVSEDFASISQLTLLKPSLTSFTESSAMEQEALEQATDNLHFSIPSIKAGPENAHCAGFTIISNAVCSGSVLSGSLKEVVTEKIGLKEQAQDHDVQKQEAHSGMDEQPAVEGNEISNTQGEVNICRIPKELVQMEAQTVAQKYIELTRSETNTSNGNSSLPNKKRSRADLESSHFIDNRTSLERKDSSDNSNGHLETSASPRCQNVLKGQTCAAGVSVSSFPTVPLHSSAFACGLTGQHS